MNMTIPSTGLCLTERQVQGIMTSNFTQTVDLQGWDAFKDFVIAILNYLPYVHVSTKKEKCEELLHELFPDYANNQSSVNDFLSMFENLKTFWSYIEDKTPDNQKSYALTMASDPDNRRVTFSFYPQQGHEIDYGCPPAVSLECALSDDDLAILPDITKAFMTAESEESGFRFDATKMNENCVAFAQIRRKYNL